MAALFDDDLFSDSNVSEFNLADKIESSDGSETVCEENFSEAAEANPQAPSLCSSSSSDSVITATPVVETGTSPKPTRTRKRVRCPDSWKRSKIKKQRNSGKEYVGRTGKTVAEKVFSNVPCGCKLKCETKVAEGTRRNLFNKFWALGNRLQQNTFICGLIKIKNVCRRRARDNTRSSKGSTYEYTLPCPNNTIHVCKKYFLDTYQVSNGRVMREMMQFKQTASPALDKRKARPAHNKLPQELLDGINNHINRFPADTSHYTRKNNPTRKYLSPSLNIRKMYALYVEACKETGEPFSKESAYRRVFNTEHNLHFRSPRSDTCKTCDENASKLKTNISDAEKEKIKQSQELHLCKAERARAELQADTVRSKSGDVYGLSIDLQKALPFPKLTVSIAYYKRNMYVYNLGVNELGSGNGFMYMWDETTASRGSQEIASVLVKHLETHAADQKYVVIYSDGCTGQNRNIKVSTTLMKLVARPDLGIEIIDHKFLVPGHTYLPNDAQFGVIETSTRKVEKIFSPEEWYDHVKKARKKNPYEVIRLDRTDVLATKPLEQAITNRKLDTDRQPVNWLKMLWMRYEKTDPHVLKFKQTSQADIPFRSINFAKRARGRQQQLCNVVQHPLYPRKRAVTVAKKK